MAYRRNDSVPTEPDNRTLLASIQLSDVISISGSKADDGTVLINVIRQSRWFHDLILDKTFVQVECTDCGQLMLRSRYTTSWKPNLCFACNKKLRREVVRKAGRAYRVRHGLVQRPDVLACAHCRAEFTPKRSTAQFCSPKCRVAAHRAKAQEHPAPKRFHISSLLMENPPNSKRVTRPSRWGNPFRVGVEASTAAEAVALFRDHLAQHPELVELARRELRGFDLGCTCPLDQPCHADVWLQVVNS